MGNMIEDQPTFTLELRMPVLRALSKSLGIVSENLLGKLDNAPARFRDQVRSEYLLINEALDEVRDVVTENL